MENHIITDVVIHPLKAFTHYAHLSLSQYLDEDLRTNSPEMKIPNQKSSKIEFLIKEINSPLQSPLPKFFKSHEHDQYDSQSRGSTPIFENSTRFLSSLHIEISPYRRIYGNIHSAKQISNLHLKNETLNLIEETNESLTNKSSNLSSSAFDEEAGETDLQNDLDETEQKPTHYCSSVTIYTDLSSNDDLNENTDTSNVITQTLNFSIISQSDNEPDIHTTNNEQIYEKTKVNVSGKFFFLEISCLFFFFFSNFK